MINHQRITGRTRAAEGAMTKGWRTAFTIAFIGSFLGIHSNAASAVLEATDDTFTASATPDTNYGSSPFVRVRESVGKSGFLQFDLSSLNQSAVTSAVLNVFVRSVNLDGEVNVHEVLGSWSETTITHDSSPPVASNFAGSAAIASADEGSYVPIDVTSLIQQWVDDPASALGISLQGSDGLNAQFGVRETSEGAFIDVVQGATTNSAPMITSTPPTLASVGVTYVYDVHGIDPNSSDTLSYSLDQAPISMSIDDVTGLIQWTPNSGEEGAHAVTARVQDDGQPILAHTQSFDIFVSGEPGESGTNLLYFTTLGNTPVPGVPGPYDDADIYRFNIATGLFDRVFDARNAGLRSNADIDALHVLGPVTFYMSFNRNSGTPVPDLGTAMDEDIVLYHAGAFSWTLHGSDVGLGNDGDAEDIDGIHFLSDSSLLISTVGSPKVGNITRPRPHDVLRCDGTFGDSSSCTWSTYLDGSAVGLSASGEKLDALFAVGNDLYFSTRGPFAVSGLSGEDFDITKCETSPGGAPISCVSFSRFFDGEFSGISDDLDGAHFVTDAFADPDPALYRVVVLGSSTAAGRGASSTSQSWVGQLDAWLNTQTANHEILNLSQSGQITESYRPDGASASTDPNRSITRTLELNPDLILINLPSNNVSEGIPVATTISHYAEIKSAADAMGVPIFITTTQPRNFSDQNQRIELQNEAIALQQNFGAIVVDIYTELTDFGNDLAVKSQYDSGDGTHVNDAGHTFIFETMRDVIAPYVTQ